MDGTCIPMCSKYTFIRDHKAHNYVSSVEERARVWNLPQWWQQPGWSFPREPLIPGKNKWRGLSICEIFNLFMHYNVSSIWSSLVFVLAGDRSPLGKPWACVLHSLRQTTMGNDDDIDLQHESKVNRQFIQKCGAWEIFAGCYSVYHWFTASSHF